MPQEERVGSCGQARWWWVSFWHITVVTISLHWMCTQNVYAGTNWPSLATSRGTRHPKVSQILELPPSTLRGKLLILPSQFNFHYVVLNRCQCVGVNTICRLTDFSTCKISRSFLCKTPVLVPTPFPWRSTLTHTRLKYWARTSRSQPMANVGHGDSGDSKRLLYERLKWHNIPLLSAGCMHSQCKWILVLRRS